MLIAFTAASAIVPSILLVSFFKNRDVHPEPSRVLWITFWLGVLSTIPTVLVALPLALVLEGALDNLVAVGVADAFLCAALPEELFKLGVVYVYVRKHEAFDEPMDGIVYGVVASLGFATLENILYTIEGGVSVAIMRAFTAVPMHAACGAIMGYYFGQGHFVATSKAQRRGLWLKGYVIVVLIHGLYDAPLLWMEALAARHDGELPDAEAASVGVALLIALAVLIVSVIWAVRLVNRLRREQLELVAGGGFVLASDPSVSLTAAAIEPPVHAGDGTVAGWIMIVVGFVLSGFGGFMVLGGVLALASGAVSADEVSDFFVGLAVLSVPTLGAGIPLFVGGLRKLPKKQRRRTNVEQWRHPS